MSMTDDGDHDLAPLLADPSLWLEPSPSGQDAVLALIRAERDGAPGAHPTGDASGANVRPLRPSRRRWSTHVGAGLLGAAAAAMLAVVVARPANDGNDGGGDQAVDGGIEVALLGTDLAPGFTGTASVSTQPSGVLIRFSVPGLPRREGEQFYEGWLKNCEGTELVPIGTFHDMDRAAGWAGVAVEDYPLLTVTAEQVAGPADAEQGSSGEVVVTGEIAPCPDD